MALTLNGSNNTITGLAVGGLPDGIVDTDMIADGAITGIKGGSGSIIKTQTTSTVLNSAPNGETWTAIMSMSYTPLRSNSILIANVAVRCQESGSSTSTFRTRIRDTTNSSNILNSSGGSYAQYFGSNDVGNIISTYVVQYSGVVLNGTSARTYEFQMYEESGGTLTIGPNSYGSSFTIMELAA